MDNAPLKPLRMQKVTTTARGLAQQAEVGDLLLDAPYQRGSVWTTEQRRGLIRSLMLGLPVPSLILNDRWEAHFLAPDGERDTRTAVVDGRQRMETLIDWFAGRLAVPAVWFASEQVATTTPSPDGPMVTYSGLTEVTQRVIAMDWTVQTVAAQTPSLAEEAGIYLLVNGAGTSQTQQDLDNARSFL